MTAAICMVTNVGGFFEIEETKGDITEARCQARDDANTCELIYHTSPSPNRLPYFESPNKSHGHSGRLRKPAANI